MDYLKRFGQNFKCFFKGDGQKIARECQIDNFAESGRSGVRYLFPGLKRVSDFENQISRIISECGLFLSLRVRVTSRDGQLYCI